MLGEPVFFSADRRFCFICFAHTIFWNLFELVFLHAVELLFGRSRWSVLNISATCRKPTSMRCTHFDPIPIRRTLREQFRVHKHLRHCCVVRQRSISYRVMYPSIHGIRWTALCVNWNRCFISKLKIVRQFPFRVASIAHSRQNVYVLVLLSVP